MTNTPTRRLPGQRFRSTDGRRELQHTGCVANSNLRAHMDRGVFFTKARTQPPHVQHLAFRKIESEDIRMVAPTGAPAGVACAE